jgi:Cu(I)-responsive transcriptional regulator
MNIGEAAKRSGVSAKMIRYYEDAGLIAKAARSLAGYRHFEDTDIHRLRFIHRARELGFSIPRIAELLSLWDDKTRSNSQVTRLAESHIGDLQREIAALRSVVKTLERLSESLPGRWPRALPNPRRPCQCRGAPKSFEAETEGLAPRLRADSAGFNGSKRHLTRLSSP